MNSNHELSMLRKVCISALTATTLGISSAMPYNDFSQAAHINLCSVTTRTELLAILHAQIFANGSPFDYGVTLSDAVDMPVNLGMQFVPRWTG